jgi:small multidrug resistance family-3 protein
VKSPNESRGGGAVEKLAILGFLLVATILEAGGDAIVRMGLNQPATAPRALLFLAGAALLFGYGLALNLAPIEFGRVIGIYVAVLFVVWQVVNFVAFRSLPSLSVLVGGALVVVGGTIIAFWDSA